MPAPAPASIPPATGLGARERLALVAVLMAVALATLDSTIVNTALPGIAAAQDAKEENTLDTISITGSRIKQTNAVTAQPVYVLDRAKLEETGAKSVGEILQQLTASGSTTPPAAPQLFPLQLLRGGERAGGGPGGRGRISGSRWPPRRGCAPPAPRRARACEPRGRGWRRRGGRRSARCAAGRARPHRPARAALTSPNDTPPR